MEFWDSRDFWENWKGAFFKIEIKISDFFWMNCWIYFIWKMSNQWKGVMMAREVSSGDVSI